MNCSPLICFHQDCEPLSFKMTGRQKLEETFGSRRKKTDTPSSILVDCRKSCNGARCNMIESSKYNRRVTYCPFRTHPSTTCLPSRTTSSPQCLVHSVRIFACFHPSIAAPLMRRWLTATNSLFSSKLHMRSPTFFIVYGRTTYAAPIPTAAGVVARSSIFLFRDTMLPAIEATRT